jgi:hypothetical protein
LYLANNFQVITTRLSGRPAMIAAGHLPVQPEIDPKNCFRFTQQAWPMCYMTADYPRQFTSARFTVSSAGGAVGFNLRLFNANDS